MSRRAGIERTWRGSLSLRHPAVRLTPKGSQPLAGGWAQRRRRLRGAQFDLDPEGVV